MSKKIVNIVSVILLLFVGFVALTQEAEIEQIENEFELQDIEENNGVSPLTPKESARWFKSNSGGIAIKEIKSRIIALRSEYALSIESAHPDEIPVYLQDFYKDEYRIEARTLYKNAKQSRVQWLFRDINDKIKLIAVVFESTEERIASVTADAAEVSESAEIAEGEDEMEAETVKAAEDRTETVERKNGFIEIYNDESNLLTEYAYYANGNINRINFEYNENKLVNASLYKSNQDEEEKYVKTFTDYYLYNRSSALRSIERIFHADMIAKPADGTVKISFPRNIKNMSNNDLLINERLNLYPEFFGEVFIEGDSKIVYDMDNRGRVIKQTLFNEDDEVIWVISNTWKNNRIVLTEKIEGDLKLAAEYEYNLAGDKISEKNYNNGVLERTVVAEGGLEIEELYFDNVVILRAVWEEGIKISETRVR